MSLLLLHGIEEGGEYLKVAAVVGESQVPLLLPLSAAANHPRIRNMGN